MARKQKPIFYLERYRSIFFLLGLALSLGLVIWLFNLKFWQDPPQMDGDAKIYEYQVDEDVIPITEQRQVPQKVSKPIKAPEEINLVDDALEIDDDFEFMETETDETEALTDKQYVVSDSAGGGEIKPVTTEFEESDEPLAFAVVENPPIFPGCERYHTTPELKRCFEQQTLEFVLENFNYSDKARNLRLSGRVFVQFIIEKDGRVSNVEVVRGLDPMLDEEAVRVVSQLPPMQPAGQRGQPVRMKFVLPIHLVLK